METTFLPALVDCPLVVFSHCKPYHSGLFQFQIWHSKPHSLNELVGPLCPLSPTPFLTFYSTYHSCSLLHSCLSPSILSPLQLPALSPLAAHLLHPHKTHTGYLPFSPPATFLPLHHYCSTSQIHPFPPATHVLHHSYPPHSSLLWLPKYLHHSYPPPLCNGYTSLPHYTCSSILPTPLHR